MECAAIHALPRFVFFFFNDTATTEIYTLSLHDALPISVLAQQRRAWERAAAGRLPGARQVEHAGRLARSEEHTSELQSQSNLVCRLLLGKKKMHIAQVPFESHLLHAHHLIGFPLRAVYV